jgi:hypothetical protein
MSVALNPGDPATLAKTSGPRTRRRRFAARPRPLHPRDRPEAGVIGRIESIFRPSAMA